MAKWFFAAVVFLLSGCASYEDHFRLGHQGFQDANAECRYRVYRENQANRFRNRKIFMDCLFAKGYKQFHWP